jgi:hypothetical protein
LISDSAKRFYVYVDYTADDHTPFYVGKGDAKRVKKFKRNPKHKNESNKHGMYRRIVLDTSDEQQAFDYEKLLIAKLHTFVEDPEAPDVACNFTLGGDGLSGFNHNAKTKEKMSEAAKNRPPFSEETRRKMSAGQRGKTLSEETKLKMSASRRGLKRSEETRRKLSEANRGQKRSDEAKEKMRAAHKNRPPISDETRRKLSAASRGRKMPPRSDETKAKISAAQRGRKLSDEQKTKNSEPLKETPIVAPTQTTKSTQNRLSRSATAFAALTQHQEALSFVAATDPGALIVDSGVAVADVDPPGAMCV